MEELFHGIEPESKYPTTLGRLVEAGETRVVGTLPAWLGLSLSHTPLP